MCFFAALSVGGGESSLQNRADLHLLTGHSNGVFSLLLSLLTSDEVLRAERNKLDARLAIWKQKATEEDQRDPILFNT